MIDLLTLVKREISRFIRVWPQTLVPPIITLVLYLIIFGNFIGSQLSDINWVKYIDFIIPGLVMMSIIMASYSNTSSSFFGAKLMGHIDELFVSSISKFKILSWFVIGSMVRALLVWFIWLWVAFLFWDIVIDNYLYFILFIILTSAVFSMAGLLNSILAKNFDQINMVPTFLITPLVYLWWVFYSIDMLPPFWENISLFNPILYIINWFRYSFLWFSDVNVYYAIIALFVFLILLALVNLYFLKNFKR